jgi:Flp pilus assembly protein TadG
VTRLWARSDRQADAGAAAVEFALVVTLLFALIFGLIAFGFALFYQQSAVQAAREAARKAAIGVANSATCSSDLTAGRDAVGSAAAATFDSMTMTIASNTYRSPVQVDVNYHVDLSLISWLPGIPSRLDLTQTAKALLESGNSGFAGTCTWTKS